MRSSSSSSSTFTFSLFFLSLCSLLLVVRCDIYDLEATSLPLYEPVLRRVVAMYSVDDAPMHFASSDNNIVSSSSSSAATADVDGAVAVKTVEEQPPYSTIQVHLQFQINGTREYIDEPDENAPLPFVEVVVLAASNLNDLGELRGDGSVESYCCTNAKIVANVPGCTEANRLIVRADPSRFASFLVPFSPDSNSAVLNFSSSTFTVTSTSEHLLLVSHCNPALGQEIIFSGQGRWHNPYGWLPGRLYGFLPFYGYGLCAYALMAFIWFALYIKHRSEIAPVQSIISAVLLLSTAEMAAWFADYYSFNLVGRRHVGFVSFSILLTVTRLTLSRVLVVAVSLGYGVTKPKLGSDKLKLILIGVLYWCFELSLELVLRYSQTNVLSERWRVSLSLPVAILNALFYWWIFISLQSTIDELQREAQTHKLNIYKQFTAVLVFSLIAAVIFAFYQIYFMTTHQFAIHWSYLWLLDGGFSMFLYTLILSMIILMWRPTEDSQKYAYSELPIQQHDDDEDEEFGQLEMTNKNTSQGGRVPDGPDGPDSDDQEDAHPAASAKFTVNEE